MFWAINPHPEPVNLKFSMEKRTYSLPHFTKFYIGLYRCRIVSLQLPKLPTLGTFHINQFYYEANHGVHRKLEYGCRSTNPTHTKTPKVF